MPDVLHWLGITRIDRFVSMSNMKYDAIIGSGIEIGERVPLPESLIPPDAQVELEAKKAAGYYTSEPARSADISNLGTIVRGTVHHLDHHLGFIERKRDMVRATARV